MSQTIADALRAEGREEGALTAVRATLLGIVKDRFGRVPKRLRQRIEATTDLAHLQAWTIRAYKVQSLNDLEL